MLLVSILAILVVCSFVLCVFWFLFFFFKQKTAYEVRISDWSSDVCSSDLCGAHHEIRIAWCAPQASFQRTQLARCDGLFGNQEQIGRASCRERVCQYV